MSLFGWLLRIIGGVIIVLGWFAYIPDVWNTDAINFMKDSVLYPIIATVLGLIVIIIGGALRSKK